MLIHERGRHGVEAVMGPSVSKKQEEIVKYSQLGTYSPVGPSHQKGQV